MMATVQESIKANSINNVMKNKNVAKKSTTKLPQSNESSRSGSPCSRPTSKVNSRENSPEKEKKLPMLNGQNKHNNVDPPISAHGDTQTAGKTIANLKRDAKESGGGDNPAKQARLQIETIEKNQEAMLQTAVGDRLLNQSDPNTEQPSSMTNGVSEMENGSSNCEESSGKVSNVPNSNSILSEDRVIADSVGVKSPKSSLAISDKLNLDIFKEKLKAAVSRVGVSDKIDPDPGDGKAISSIEDHPSEQNNYSTPTAIPNGIICDNDLIKETLKLEEKTGENLFVKEPPVQEVVNQNGVDKSHKHDTSDVDNENEAMLLGVNDSSDGDMVDDSILDEPETEKVKSLLSENTDDCDVTHIDVTDLTEEKNAVGPIELSGSNIVAAETKSESVKEAGQTHSEIEINLEHSTVEDFEETRVCVDETTEDSHKRKLSQTSNDDETLNKKVKLDAKIVQENEVDSVSSLEVHNEIKPNTGDAFIAEMTDNDNKEEIEDLLHDNKEKSEDVKSEFDSKISEDSTELKKLLATATKPEVDHDSADTDATLTNDEVMIMDEEEAKAPSTSEITDEAPSCATETSSDEFLKISRKTLERMISQKMENLLSSSDYVKQVADLQNRISKLTMQVTKWKVAAKKYENQLKECTTRVVERRRQPRVLVRHVCIQVDESKIQAGQQFTSPAKSAVQKTPPRPSNQTTNMPTAIRPAMSAAVSTGQAILVPVAGATANGTMTLIAPSTLPPASVNLTTAQYKPFTNAVATNPTVKEILETRQPSNPVEKASSAAKSASEKVIDLTEDDDASPNKASVSGQLVVRQAVPVQNTQTPMPNTSTSLPTGTYLVPVTNGQPILLQQMVGSPSLVYTSRPGVGPQTQVILQSTTGQQLVALAPGQAALRPMVTQTALTPALSRPNTATRMQGNKASPTANIGARGGSYQPRPQQIKHPAPLPPQPVTTKLGPELKALAPKPSLKISRVPQGIVLSWNMTLNDAIAGITNYQLFAYQESTSAPVSTLWKRVGDVKALPLPMACTLTQFHEGNKYHFAVRAVDEHGRIGPFSDPSSIHLESVSKS